MDNEISCELGCILHLVNQVVMRSIQAWPAELCEAQRRDEIATSEYNQMCTAGEKIARDNDAEELHNRLGGDKV
jgi:hypothetical protein